LHLINDFGANESVIPNGCDDVRGNQSQALNNLCKQKGKTERPAEAREDRRRNEQMSSEVTEESSSNVTKK